MLTFYRKAYTDFLTSIILQTYNTLLGFRICGVNI